MDYAGHCLPDVKIRLRVISPKFYFMPALTRRDFLKLSALAIAGTAVTSTAYILLSNELNQPVVYSVILPIPGLPAPLEGFRIVQISDIHLYWITQPGLVREAVFLANSLRPDLTLLTGDYVWTTAEAAFELAPILAGLEARQGVYASLGNHDYWAGISAVKQAFADQRLPILINQGLPVGQGGAVFYLAGLDDAWAGRPDLDLALQSAPGGAPVILMYHEPDPADQIARDGRVAVQLAGHTHGGQVRIGNLPSFATPHLGRKYDRGLFRIQDMWLYVNQGLGVISVPVRFNCPPEVTQFILTGA